MRRRDRRQGRLRGTIRWSRPELRCSRRDGGWMWRCREVVGGVKVSFSSSLAFSTGLRRELGAERFSRYNRCGFNFYFDYWRRTGTYTPGFSGGSFVSGVCAGERAAGHFDPWCGTTGRPSEWKRSVPNLLFICTGGNRSLTGLFVGLWRVSRICSYHDVDVECGPQRPRFASLRVGERTASACTTC